VCGKSLRRECLNKHKLSMVFKNNCNQCDLCGQKYSYKTKDEQIDSALCKRTQNINAYAEIIGGYRIMAEKHIAHGDVDFDGVIKLEPHEKIQNITITNKTKSIMLMYYIVVAI